MKLQKLHKHFQCFQLIKGGVCAHGCVLLQLEFCFGTFTPFDFILYKIGSTIDKYKIHEV